ncbi:MAG: SUMF1/EgtB/PvdO family nonheme iron enzyme, partial [Anaerolineae bacterium]|nr:SUMF1/EgtB/PvdO family nonheme iron enzyme [Anaerolineae bacterium]
ATSTDTATATNTATATPSITPVPPTATTTLTPSPTPPIMGIVNSLQTVNVRRGPGASFGAFEALFPGTEVQIIGVDETGRWLNVRLEDGREGWINSPLVRIDPTNTPLATFTLLPDQPTPTLTPTEVITGKVASSQAVNVRAGPGTDYRVVAVADANITITILGQNTEGDWLQVRTSDGRSGWISASQVRLESAPPVIDFIARNADWTPVERDFDGVTMMLVPVGCFDMGSTANDDEQPVHEQCFDTPFWIDKTEVTQAQFRANNGVQASSNHFTGDNRPVEVISWFEARDYCEARGARLPNEAEWEYAARGPDALTYTWGNTFVAEDAVYVVNSNVQTANVGSKPGGASWVGALDMAGNLWEWTSSLYRPYPYIGGDGREADTGTRTDVQRVLRGGSWLSNSDDLRAPNRSWILTISKNFDYGFRCARDLDSTDTTETLRTQLATLTTILPLPTDQVLFPIPTTSGEPVIQSGADVYAYCDSPAFGGTIRAPTNLASGSTVEIRWNWFAKTEQQIRDHLESAQYEITINGVSIDNPLDYATTISPSGGDFVLDFFYPTEPLTAGIYQVVYRVTWREQIFDGYDYFGPETNNPEVTGTCTFAVR